MARLLRISREELTARIDAKLASVKDGYTPKKGKDYFDGKDGKTPVAGVDFPLPKNGEDGKDANIEEVVKLAVEQTIPKVLTEIEKQMPTLGESVRNGLELLQGDKRLNVKMIDGVTEHIVDVLTKHSYSGGGGSALQVLQSGNLKIQSANAINFKGTGAPTVSIDSKGITQLDFPGSGGSLSYDEIVAGTGTTFTLAHTPITGTVRVYSRGQRILPTINYTLVGAIITTVDTLSAGDITADYNYL
jgi:hypothetical protein